MVDALLDSLPQSYCRASQVGRGLWQAGRQVAAVARGLRSCQVGGGRVWSCSTLRALRSMVQPACEAARSLCQTYFQARRPSPQTRFAFALLPLPVQVDSAMGPALQAAFLVMNHIGGKLLLFQVGCGAAHRCAAQQGDATWSAAQRMPLARPNCPQPPRVAAGRAVPKQAWRVQLPLLDAHTRLPSLLGCRRLPPPAWALGGSRHATTRLCTAQVRTLGAACMHAAWLVRCGVQALALRGMSSCKSGRLANRLSCAAEHVLCDPCCADREYSLRTPDDPFYKRFSAEASRCTASAARRCVWVCGLARPPGTGGERHGLGGLPGWGQRRPLLFSHPPPHHPPLPPPPPPPPLPAWRRFQICIDVFAFGGTYMDLPSLGALPKYTGGQLYYYPGFQVERDGAKLHTELW